MGKMMQKRKRIAFRGSNKFTRYYKNRWRRVKPSIRLGMTNIRLTTNFELVTKNGYISTVRKDDKGRKES